MICQKQAALEVVRKRLDKERLGNRFVMITDVNSDRGAIIASVREQVERLHSQPVGGAPAWKRDRERLAARIESLEADLDRQQTALHSVDPNTGLTYRTLLGELLAIEAAQPKPMDFPSIRPLLTDLHPADVVTLEENCGPLARFWLPAKFEGSALSDFYTLIRAYQFAITTSSTPIGADATESMRRWRGKWSKPFSRFSTSPDPTGL